MQQTSTLVHCYCNCPSAAELNASHQRCCKLLHNLVLQEVFNCNHHCKGVQSFQQFCWLMSSKLTYDLFVTESIICLYTKEVHHVYKVAHVFYEKLTKWHYIPFLNSLQISWKLNNLLSSCLMFGTHSVLLPVCSAIGQSTIWCQALNYIKVQKLPKHSSWKMFTSTKCTCLSQQLTAVLLSVDEVVWW